MEEKNVQNNAELNEEQLEQTAGGAQNKLKCILCRKCGKSHLFAAGATIGSFTCECGAELHG
ncbi:MAG: hypothetical protein ACI4WX_05890 [Aristaeellaceae bacterium]